MHLTLLTMEQWSEIMMDSLVKEGGEFFQSRGVHRILSFFFFWELHFVKRKTSSDEFLKPRRWGLGNKMRLNQDEVFDDELISFVSAKGREQGMAISRMSP